MNKTLATFLLIIVACVGKAQTSAQNTPGVMPFGQVDIADLEMKACDFERDANAEVLFDKGDTYYDLQLHITQQRHKRIKIFNENGLSEAQIRISFEGGRGFENITGLQAQTINLVNGKPEIVKLDKSQIFTKVIDKVNNEIAFTFPNVKAGSIIEYKYTWTTVSYANFPDWFFQQTIPVRYSEYNTEIPSYCTFRTHIRVYDPFVKDQSKTESRTGHSVEIRKRAVANIHSLPYEPYMSSFTDNLQCIVFQLSGVSSTRLSIYKSYADTWPSVGNRLSEDEDFGGQLTKKLKDEELILTKAAALKTIDEKIAYIFGEVKNTMKWDGVDRWYTIDGTVKAWERRSGNSAEINIILYHLLKQAGVDVYPMVVSTRDHGKVTPLYASLGQFNRAVVFVSLKDDYYYLLDATNKFNTYSDIPADLLNSDGLFIDKSKKRYKIMSLLIDGPINQSVYINAQIKPDGKIEGTANIKSESYYRTKALEVYKTDGEKKYIDYLQTGDNGLKIKEVKMDNLDVDTLPLVQNIAFTLDITGADGNYIMLNPNLFSSLKTNPFLAEQRLTDVEFGYNRSYTIGGRYTLPAGYKIDAMPKSGSIVMPDKSISFKRIVGEQDGTLSIRYTIDFTKSVYAKEGYPDFREFMKELYEKLNEPIVLKKI